MRFRRLWRKEKVLENMAQVRGALRRFPLTLGLCVLLGVLLIWMTEMGYPRDIELYERVNRGALAVLLGIGAALCLDTFFDRREGTGRFLRIGASAALLGLLWVYDGWILPGFGEFQVMLRHFLWVGASVVFFFVASHFPRRMNLELFAVRTLTRLFVTLAYSAVLGLGISAILFAITNLLYADLSRNLYGHTWALVGTVFAPLFFLGGMPGAREVLRTAEYGKLFRTLLLYILIPLLGAYTTVLYLYFFRILLSREWPSGMVAYLVVFSAAIGLAALFLLEPIREEKKWGQGFARVYPLAVYPLLAMMLLAIGMRIGQYGITENRWFLLVAGVWMLFAFAFFHLLRSVRRVFLPLSLAVILVVVSVGPASAFSVSRQSQARRFGEILTRYELWENGDRATRAAGVDPADLRQLYEIADYFVRYHDLAALPLLEEGEQTTDEALSALLGTQRPEWWAGPADPYLGFHASTEEISLPISGYDHYLALHAWGEGAEEERGSGARAFEVEGQRYEVSWEPRYRLRLSTDGRVLAEIDLDEYALGISEQLGPRERGREPILLEHETADARLLIAIHGMELRRPEGLAFFSGVLFVDIREP